MTHVSLTTDGSTREGPSRLALDILLIPQAQALGSRAERGLDDISNEAARNVPEGRRFEQFVSSQFPRGVELSGTHHDSTGPQ
jgi:hypothetical protein